MRFGTRIDKDQGMDDKIRSVEAKLNTSTAPSVVP
jgi:hypothetical protein